MIALLLVLAFSAGTCLGIVVAGLLAVARIDPDDGWEDV